MAKGKNKVFLDLFEEQTKEEVNKEAEGFDEVEFKAQEHAKLDIYDKLNKQAELEGKITALEKELDKSKKMNVSLSNEISKLRVENKKLLEAKKDIPMKVINPKIKSQINPAYKAFLERGMVK